MPPFPPSTIASWLFASALYGAVYYFQGIRKDAAWVLSTNTEIVPTFIEATVVSAFAGISIYATFKKYYLTSRTQRWPAIVAWATLASTYPALSGALLVATRYDVILVNPMRTPVDWPLIAQTILFSQYGVLAAAAVSLLWMIDDPGYSAARRARLSILVALEKVKAAQRVAQADYDSLSGGASLLESEGGRAAARAIDNRDAVLLQKWAAAGKKTLEYLKPRDAGNVKPTDKELIDLETALRSAQ